MMVTTFVPSLERDTTTAVFTVRSTAVTVTGAQRPGLSTWAPAVGGSTPSRIASSANATSVAVLAPYMWPTVAFGTVTGTPGRTRPSTSASSRSAAADPQPSPKSHATPLAALPAQS